MSSCSTIPPSSSVYTSYSTSTVTGEQVSTLPGATSTVSSPVLVTNCPAAPTDAASGASAPACTTSTSYSVFTTTVPGSTTTVYSTGQTLVPVYSTSFGPASTVCVAVETTVPTSAASPTTTAAPSNQPTSVATATSQAVVVVGGSSSTRILTTTSTFIPGQSGTAGGTSDSAVSPAAGVVTATRSQEMVLSTSYLTLVFTTTDNSGHASTFASAVPTLLNVPKRNVATTNKGAIAGGVVGGIAALLLAVLAFLLMKKRGLFRKGDDEIEEDAWAPPAHGEYYGTASGRNRTTTGGTLVGAAGGGLDDEKLGDSDRQMDAATLERHQSWYVTGGAGGRVMEEISREYPSRSNSPHGFPGAAEAIGATAMGYPGVSRSRSDGGLGPPQPTRSTSNRLSVYSGSGGSSHGHSQEYASPSYPQHLPSIPDPRLSGFAYYPNYPNQSHTDGYQPASPPHQRPRSASPTASPQYNSPVHSRSNTLSHRLSSNALALPAHLRHETHGSRPTLEAIQGAGRDPSSSTSSSSSPSRGDTAESVPTTSTHLLHHSNSYGSATTNAYSLPQLDRLKLQRPAFERAASTESFVAPTQWLGARVANGDTASESGLESKEDLTEKLRDLPHTHEEVSRVQT